MTAAVAKAVAEAKTKYIPTKQYYHEASDPTNDECCYERHINIEFTPIELATTQEAIVKKHIDGQSDKEAVMAAN